MRPVGKGQSAASHTQGWLERHENVHRQASVLLPWMFMAQLPQIPSLQLRRNVSVGSISFLTRISASRTMGPVWFRSSS